MREFEDKLSSMVRPFGVFKVFGASVRFLYEQSIRYARFFGCNQHSQLSGHVALYVFGFSTRHFKDSDFKLSTGSSASHLGLWHFKFVILKWTLFWTFGCMSPSR